MKIHKQHLCEEDILEYIISSNKHLYYLNLYNKTNLYENILFCKKEKKNDIILKKTFFLMKKKHGIIKKRFLTTLPTRDEIFYFH